MWRYPCKQSFSPNIYNDSLSELIVMTKITHEPVLRAMERLKELSADPETRKLAEQRDKGKSGGKSRVSVTS